MAEPVNNTASLQLRFEALEDLQTVPGASSPQVLNDDFNWDLVQLKPTTTPPVARVSYQEYTVGGGGTVDIDLYALASTQGTIAGNGMKLQLIVINNTAVTSINVAQGASNPYLLFGSGNDVDIPAGCKLAFYVPESLADISSTVRNIRITGTASAVVEVGIWIG